MALDYSGAGAATFTAPALLATPLSKPIIAESSVSVGLEASVTTTPCQVELWLYVYDILNQRIGEYMLVAATISATLNWQRETGFKTGAWGLNAARIRLVLKVISGGEIRVNECRMDDVTAANNLSNVILSRQEAQSARNEAGVHSANALSQATLAADSANTAGDHALAASQQAFAASSWASDAEQFATSASTSLTSAETAAGQAATSVIEASQARDTAAGSATQASISAGTAAEARVAAGGHAALAGTSASQASSAKTGAESAAAAAVQTEQTVAAIASTVDGRLVTVESATTTQATATADLQGNASAGYLIKAQAGGSVSLLSLIAADGSAGTASIAKLSANDIILGNSVDSVHIKGGAITAHKLVANAVTAAKISSGAVSAAKIAANAVTADKINVTSLSAISANLGSIMVGSANIANGSITNAKIGGSIQSDVFNNNAGWHIKQDGSAIFRGPVISRTLRIATGSQNIGTVNSVDFISSPEENGNFKKIYSNVIGTGFAIPAWNGLKKGYTATAGASGNLTIFSHNASNCIWGFSAEPVAQTKFTGGGSIWVRYHMFGRHVTKATGTVAVSVYEVT